MGDFLQCMDVVFAAEGGVSNHPADLGGKTNLGITEGLLATIKHPKQDPEDLTIEDAMEIYRKHFWNPVMGNDLPGPVALIVFDMAVNSGVKKAVMRLQYVLMQLCPVMVDGVMGPDTLRKAQQCYAKYGYFFLGELLQARREYYNDIIRNNPSQAVFAKGWNNRINNLLREIMSWAS